MKPRSFVAPSAAFALLVGCGLGAGCSGARGAEGRASTIAITSVDQTGVKRQSIGNCWIYATASWSESLNKTATGAEPNFSESYWTYWHWFEQIANGSVGSAVETGGTFDVAAELINRYGVMNEADFIPSEASAEMSARQASAEAAIDAELRGGSLRTTAARADRARVRAALDRAFGLSAAVIGELDAVFGADVSATLDAGAVPVGHVRAAGDIAAKVFDAETNTVATITLQDAIGARAADGSRVGRYAWNEVYYPTSSYARRQFQKRFQNALHHKVPVVLSWFVDFNAMAPGGKFLAPPATPGRQGGHMVVLEDYQASNVPGYGVLPAGLYEVRRDALVAALDDRAVIDFLRVKNSWGSVRADRSFTVGYHDLYMEYLDGPVARCPADADDNPIPGAPCTDVTPFTSVVVPPMPAQLDPGPGPDADAGLGATGLDASAPEPADAGAGGPTIHVDEGSEDAESLLHLVNLVTSTYLVGNAGISTASARRIDAVSRFTTVAQVLAVTSGADFDKLVRFARAHGY